MTPGTFVRDDVGTPVDLCIESSQAVQEDLIVNYAIIDGTAVGGEGETLNTCLVASMKICITIKEYIKAEENKNRRRGMGWNSMTNDANQNCKNFKKTSKKQDINIH